MLSAGMVISLLALSNQMAFCCRITCNTMEDLVIYTIQNTSSFLFWIIYRALSFVLTQTASIVFLANRNIIGLNSGHWDTSGNFICIKSILIGEWLFLFIFAWWMTRGLFFLECDINCVCTLCKGQEKKKCQVPDCFRINWPIPVYYTIPLVFIFVWKKLLCIWGSWALSIIQSF